MYPWTYSDLDESEIGLLRFMEWAAPFIYADRGTVLEVAQNLATKHPERLDVARLVSSVNSAFARPILELCKRTLILQLGIARHNKRLSGETTEARFEDFMIQLNSDAGRLQLDENYPFLRLGVARSARQTARCLVALFERVTVDHANLAGLTADFRSAGRLTNFKTELSDRHADGQSVMLLKFEHGNVYYKPRSLKLDLAYFRFLSFLNERGVRPDQRAPVALDRTSYGYVGEVLYQEAQSKSDLRAYYQRFGGLLAICHILVATDLHHENLISAGGYPIIIDVETLFQPSLVSRRSKERRRNPFADTVINSGMLPCGLDDQKQYGVSALFMPYETLFSRLPLGEGTDELSLREMSIKNPFTKNMPRLGGEMAQPHRYVDAITSGFECTYRGLLSLKAELIAKDSPLAVFKNLYVRTVIRPTRVYGHILSALSHPDFLTAEGKREDLIARLRATTNGPVAHRRCWPAERAAILRGDVPYFTAKIDSRDLQDGLGGTVAGLFGGSGWSESRRRIWSMSQRDLKRQQRLIHESVICTQPMAQLRAWHDMYPSASANAHDGVICNDDFIAEAVRIGDHIIESGFGDDGHVDHFQLECRGLSEMRLFHMGPGLYAGLAGLAVFLAELYLQTGLARFMSAAEVTIASARREYTQFGIPSESIGAFSGMSGWIYTLALLGKRHNRLDWIEESLSWLPWIEKRIDADTELDVISGSAGALLVLTELDCVAPERGALQLARACAMRLATTAIQDENGARWISAGHPEIALTGFSHGAAGIATALARYAVHSGCTQYLELAQETMRYERNSYDANGWRDIRALHCNEHGTTNYPYAWCHGAPGIGLARLALPQIMHDEAWLQDVERSVKHTRAHGFGGGHSLCHGQLGNIELLMKYGELCHKGESPRSWRDTAARVLEEGRDGWRFGNLKGPDTLGFMTGLAGIGYALLRIATPLVVPSVLLLELK